MSVCAHVCALISHASSERGHNPPDFNPITSNFSTQFSEEKFNPSGFQFYKVISHERKYSLKKKQRHIISSQYVRVDYTDVSVRSRQTTSKKKKKKNPHHIIIHLYAYCWLFLSLFTFYVSILHFIVIHNCQPFNSCQYKAEKILPLVSPKAHLA